MGLTTREACEIARALPGVEERDHFGSDAFYVHQIFATVWHKKNAVNLNLDPKQQERCLLIDGEAFSQIDNAWGRRGWTKVDLEFVEREDFVEALQAAWERSAKKPRRRGVSKRKAASGKKTKKRSGKTAGKKR